MILLDMVPVDVPELLGLDVLDAERLCAGNVSNLLVHRQLVSRSNDGTTYKDGWSVLIVRRDGHLYLRMCFPASTFYTTVQLKKLHRRFAHSSSEKLYNLLQGFGLEPLTPETLECLKEIVAGCESCQRIRNAPLRFHVTMGHEHVRFNARAYLDILYLEGRPSLRIKDEATRFSAA